MKASVKLLIIIFSLAFITWILSYFLSPFFSISQSIDISASSLINKEFYDKSFNFGLKFSEDNKLHVLQSVNNINSDFIYKFQLDEGIVRVSNDYTFVFIGDDKLIYLQKNIFLWEYHHENK